MPKDTVNIFEAASLLQLSTGVWQATKMLNDAEVSKLADPEWVRAKKHLVDQEWLLGPKQAINAARKYIKMMALPFPVIGLVMVSKDAISSIDDRLLQKQDEFFSQVRRIALNYPRAREEARQYLEPRGLYNVEDYPDDIIPLYRFRWRYMDITVPAKLQQVAPQVYARQVAEFEALMKEAQELAIASLYEEIADLVENMVERLGTSEEDGKPKKFKDSLVGNFTQFFENFQTRNIFDNPKLTEIVEQAKRTLNGVTPDGLRQFPDFRQKIKSQMESVKQAIDEAVVDMPRRKFKLDPEKMAA